MIYRNNSEVAEKWVLLVCFVFIPTKVRDVIDVDGKCEEVRVILLVSEGTQVLHEFGKATFQFMRTLGILYRASIGTFGKKHFLKLFVKNESWSVTFPV